MLFAEWTDCEPTIRKLLWLLSSDEPPHRHHSRVPNTVRHAVPLFEIIKVYPQYLYGSFQISIHLPSGITY
jgi:hypothetical protein